MNIFHWIRFLKNSTFFSFYFYAFNILSAAALKGKNVDLVSRCSQLNDLEATSTNCHSELDEFTKHFRYFFFLVGDSALFPPLNSEYTTLMIYKFE